MHGCAEVRELKLPLVLHGDIYPKSSTFDDVEVPDSPWAIEGAAGDTVWHRVPSEDSGFHWNGRDIGNISDTSLVTPPLDAVAAQPLDISGLAPSSVTLSATVTKQGLYGATKPYHASQIPVAFVLFETKVTHCSGQPHRSLACSHGGRVLSSSSSPLFSISVVTEPLTEWSSRWGLAVVLAPDSVGLPGFVFGAPTRSVCRLVHRRGGRPNVSDPPPAASPPPLCASSRRISAGARDLSPHTLHRAEPPETARAPVCELLSSSVVA